MAVRKRDGVPRISVANGVVADAVVKKNAARGLVPVEDGRGGVHGPQGRAVGQQGAGHDAVVVVVDVVAGGDVHARVAGRDELVGVGVQVGRRGARAGAVAVGGHARARIHVAGGRKRVSTLHVVVVHAGRALGRAARVVEVDVVLDRRKIGLVNHLVPGNFDVGHVAHRVQADEVGQFHTAIARAAVDVQHLVAQDAHRLAGRAVAAELVDGEARGVLQVVVFGADVPGVGGGQEAAPVAVVLRGGGAKGLAVEHRDVAGRAVGLNQVAGAHQHAALQRNRGRGSNGDGGRARIGAAVVARVGAALGDGDGALVRDVRHALGLCQRGHRRQKSESSPHADNGMLIPG